MSELDGILSDQDGWAKADVGGEYNEELADGEYIFRITKIKIDQFGTDKKWKVLWQMETVSEPAGRFAPGIFTDLEGENKKFTKKILTTLQSCPEQFSEVPQVLEKLIGIKVMGEIKTKNGYKNTYINKLMPVGTQDSAPKQAAPF